MVYNVIPLGVGTFIKNFDNFEMAKAYAQAIANEANLTVGLYENRPTVDKLICKISPAKTPDAAKRQEGGK